MNRILRLLTAATLFAASCQVQAQDLNTAYFTDEFTFRHDLNPAFGNEMNYVSVPMLGNFGVTTMGNVGVGDILFDNPMPGGKKKTTFMNPYISDSEALAGFSKGNNRIAADARITILSAGFKAFGGYNTVELNSRVDMGAVVPYELFEFARNVGNRSYTFNDIRARARGYGELAFGHSRQLNGKWRVGGKVKILMGLGQADVSMTNTKADLSDANQWVVQTQAQADVSMKGFLFKQKSKEYNRRNGSYEYVDDMDVDGFGIGGFGLAFDFGGVYRLNDDITLSAALNDLGFIAWSKNAHAENIASSFVFNGFHDIDVSDRDHPQSLESQADDYGDQLADFAHLHTTGGDGGRTTGLAATLRVGAEYVLPTYRPLSFGLLSTTRLNGPYTWTEARLSANYRPLPWLDGGVSFAANSFSVDLGWVVNVHPKGFNVFIGMDRFIGKMTKECIPLNSKASFSAGFNVTF